MDFSISYMYSISKTRPVSEETLAIVKGKGIDWYLWHHAPAALEG